MYTGTHFSEIFYSQSFDDISVLEKNVNENPASSIARFLLLYHYKKNNHPDFEKFARQSSLYFDNPYWLQYQLLQNEVKKEDPGILHPAGPEEEAHVPVTIPLEENEVKEDALPLPLKDEHTGSKDTNGITGKDDNNEEKENEVLPPAIQEPMPLVPVMDNLPAPVAAPQEEPPFRAEEEMPGEDGPENNKVSGENRSEKPPAPGPETGIVNEGGLHNSNTQPKNITGAQAAEREAAAGAASHPDDHSAETTPFTQTPDIETPVPGNPEEASISFEPLHTIDYFASQGIKISEEALLNDKLGEQVKSFTDWLKSMKKLHPNKLPEQNEVIEKIIQSSAEESNAGVDVLTEAMAEVLVKQSKKEKALEMYQKLSLLNPSKSAYFAAKIESLKTN